MSETTPNVIPVTDQDRSRWLIRDAKALLQLLNDAWHEKLPPIEWTVQLGGLYGTVTRSFVRTTEQEREAFDRWVSYLGATVEPERTTDYGMVCLRAFGRLKNGETAVMLAADFYPKTEPADV